MKKKTVFFLIVTINMVLIILASIVFGSFMKKSNDTAIGESMKGMQNSSANISDRFEAYLKSNESMVDKIAAYIIEENLNVEETATFLRYQQVTEGYVVLVNAQTFQGTIYGSDNSNQQDAIDYNGCEEIVNVCENLGAVEETAQSKLKMTNVFQDAMNHKNQVAFYSGVSIEENPYVLFYVCDTSYMLQEGLSGTFIEGQVGILIDENGKLISEHSNASGFAEISDYYSFVEKYNSTELAQEIKEMISSNENGNFEIKGVDGKQWIYAFETISGTNGWVYIYSQSGSTLFTDTGFESSVIMIVVIMVLILAINIGAILRYNHVLKKDLSSVKVENVDLQSAVIEAEEANAAKSSFLSNVSHEIRTPINAVLGLDELIIRESNEPAIKEYAYDIKNAGRTLLSLVNDILDFSKIESGKMEIINVDYELGSTINDIYHMIQVKAAEKGLQFDIQVDEMIPHQLYGDEIRLKQIVINLLTNAVKYTEKGSVKLVVNGEQLNENYLKLYVEVRDTGIGLKPEEIDKLFQPFERLDEKRNRSIEGTGLGMSIVQELLLLMDSRLEVESEYGKGTTFSFEVIQKVDSWEHMGSFQERYKEVIGEQDHYREMFQAPDARILVVDDTPMNLTVVKGLLKATKLQVDTSDSGEDCIDHVQRNSYDLILMDHRMPGMDGVETLQVMREQHLCDDTPIIVLTANALNGAEEEYKEYGFADFLGKPVDGKKLEKMLVKHLPKKYIRTNVIGDSVSENAVVESVGEVKDKKRLPVKAWDQLLIDGNKGITACGTYELYEQVMKEYCETIQLRIDELSNCFQEEDWKNYSVKVHGIKSVARMIGADALSDLALELEQAGNSEDIPYIHEHEEALCKGLLEIKELVNPYFLTEKENLPEIEISELKEALTAIKESALVLDFDSIDAIMKELEDYRIPDQVRDQFQRLNQYILDVDDHGIEELIGTMERLLL